MGSRRLPGKVLADLAGEPMLARVVHRVRRATVPDDIVVATSAGPRDNLIAEMCTDRGWPVYRGSELDVLERYHRAALAVDAEAVVRVTADCPLIEPEVIDRVGDVFLAGQPDLDYVSNTWPTRSYPRGLDTEVMRFDALARAAREASAPGAREHVTPFFHGGPGIRTACVTHDADLSDLRWTVDTVEDLRFVRRIYDHFGHDRFSWREVLDLLAHHPEWSALNRHVRQKEA